MDGILTKEGIFLYNIKYNVTVNMSVKGMEKYRIAVCSLFSLRS